MMRKIKTFLWVFRTKSGLLHGQDEILAQDQEMSEKDGEEKAEEQEEDAVDVIILFLISRNVIGHQFLRF